MLSRGEARHTRATPHQNIFLGETYHALNLLYNPRHSTGVAVRGQRLGWGVSHLVP